MSKLVYLFKFEKPIAVGLPGKGVVYPDASYGVIAEPIPGRPAMGVKYNFDKIMSVDLFPEEAEPLPSTLKDVDPDFAREYKLSQAKGIAENIRSNEKIIAALRQFEGEGILKCLGRGHVDAKGKVIPEANKPTAKPAEVPLAPDTLDASVEGEIIEPPKAVRPGRPRKEATKSEE